MTYALNTPTIASFQASCAGSVLTVSAVNSGVLSLGHTLVGFGVPPGTYLASFGTATGGTGTYNLSTTPGTLSSAAMSTTTDYDSAMFTALRGWIVDSLGIDPVLIVQVPDNRTPEPLGDHIAMARVMRKDIAQNTNSYVNGNPFGVETISQSLEYVLQVNCYGDQASNWCSVLDVIFRSEQSCAFFDAYGIAPLFNDEPTQAPFINGESQYEIDWSIRMHFQFNPTMTRAMQFMDRAGVGIINVETLPR